MNAITFTLFGLGDWQARLWTGLCGLIGICLPDSRCVQVVWPPYRYHHRTRAWIEFLLGCDGTHQHPRYGFIRNDDGCAV